MSGSGGADTIRSFLVSVGYSETGRDKFVSGLADVTKQVLALGVGIAAAAAAVVTGVAKMANSLDQLFFASMRIGASVQSIRSVQFALSNLGSSAEGALSTLENMGRFLRTNPGAEGFIASIGVQTRDVNGRVRDTGDLLVDLKGKLDKMPFYQASAYAGVLGIGEKELLANTSDMRAFQETSRQMYAAAGINAQRAAKDSHGFAVEVNTLRNAFTILGEKVAAVMTRQMSDDIRRFRVWLVSNFDTISRAIVWVGRMLLQAGDILFQVAVRTGRMVDAVSGYLLNLSPSTKKAVAAIGTVAFALAALSFAFSLSPAGRIVLLALAILGLADDYDKWKKGGGSHSLIDWSVWEPGIQAATTAIKEFMVELRAMWADLSTEHPAYLFPQDMLGNIKEVIGVIKSLVAGLNNVLQLQDAISKRDWTRALTILKRINIDGGAAIDRAFTPDPDSGLQPGQDANLAARLNNIFSGRVTPGMGIGDRIREVFNPTAASRGGAGRGAGSAGGPAEAEGTRQQRGQLIHDEFIRQGFPDAQAWGAAANALHENGGGVAGTTGDGGISRGMFQWNRERRAEYNRQYGHEPNEGTVRENVAFMAWEIRNTEAGNAQRFMGAQDARSAASAMSADIIRPRDVLQNMRERGDTGQQLSTAGRAGPAPEATPPSLTDMEGRGGVSRGMLRGMEPPVPLGGPGSGNTSSITRAPVLNQTTNITVQGGPDANRQVIEGQRSVNQDSSRALAGVLR